MERALVYGQLSRDSLKLCEHLSKVEAQHQRGNCSRNWQERGRWAAIGAISIRMASRPQWPICQVLLAKLYKPNVPPRTATRYQQLADIPADDFDAALADPSGKPMIAKPIREIRNPIPKEIKARALNYHSHHQMLTLSNDKNNKKLRRNVCSRSNDYFPCKRQNARAHL